MRRLILLIAVTVLGAGAASAQLGLKFGAGATYNTPAGDFADRAGAGWGGSVQAKLGIPIITLTGAVEYLDFGDQDITGGKSTSQLWGLNVGGRFSLFPFLYAGAEIGTYQESTTTTIGNVENKGSIARGSAAPIIGVEFLGFDVNARYVFIDKTEFTTIRATYWF
jgi:hypothetical protein